MICIPSTALAKAIWKVTKTFSCLFSHCFYPLYFASCLAFVHYLSVFIVHLSQFLLDHIRGRYINGKWAHSKTIQIATACKIRSRKMLLSHRSDRAVATGVRPDRWAREVRLGKGFRCGRAEWNMPPPKQTAGSKAETESGTW